MKLIFILKNGTRFETDTYHYDRHVGLISQLINDEDECTFPINDIAMNKLIGEYNLMDKIDRFARKYEQDCLTIQEKMKNDNPMAEINPSTIYAFKLPMPLINNNDFKDNISNWYWEFVNKMENINHVIALLKFANFLHFDPLVKFCCAYIANKIKECDTTEDVVKMFGIQYPLREGVEGYKEAQEEIQKVALWSN